MQNIKEVIKTYGSSYLGEGDKNDCTVKALSVTLEVPYDKAHSFARRAWNRKKGGGVSTAAIKLSFEGIGSIPLSTLSNKKAKRVCTTKTYWIGGGQTKERKMKLLSFIKKYSSGSYYILVRGHALAVKKGELIDNNPNPNRRVLYAWLLT